VIALFIKTTKVRDVEYIKLVESYREEGKTKHRVLYNFGRADLIRNDESFLRIVKRLCEIANIPVAGKSENPFDGCSEAVLYNYGYLAYRHLWKELGIEGSIEEAECGSKITYPLPETVFLMVLQHLLEPMSKLSTYGHQNRYFHMPEIPLHHLYRALDRLSKQKEEIEASLFEYNYVRLNKKVEVVFYDVTTIHFESVNADELREFGFSKNGKFNEVQVVLGMIIDESGLPVGYELFKGNTFDGKTMVKTLEIIKKRFGINRVIIVADRGLNSKGNLNLIKEAGYGYIMAAKIRGASAALQKKVLADNGFTSIHDKLGNLDFRYKILEHENIFTDENNVRHKLPENLVVSFSPKRAKKDLADRERLIEKAKKLLDNPEKIKASNKRGGKKYINQVDPDKDKATFELAMEKIEQDAKFDGYYAIQTSEKSMSATDVMDAYHTLWKIEESFRIMKSTLELRPVYHSSPERIKGHFVVCFLAFLMERKMELLLKSEHDEGNEECSASPMKIQEALNTMQLAAVTTNQGEMFVKAKPHSLAPKIFKRLKLDMPGNISTKNDLISCFKLDEDVFPLQMTFL
jgi:transposase